MSVYAGKSALITGASAGLGEEFALQLAQLGATHLVLVARRAERLADLQTRLQAAKPRLKVDTHAVDLANPYAVMQLIRDLEEASFSPDILINNAGFGDLGLFETSAMTKIARMISLNIDSLTRLTHWVLPAMLQRKQGWICNVGSTAGIIPLPTFAVYAATKAYVNSFSEALRIEVSGSGIHVLALCPGPVETEFGQVASRPTGQRKFAPPAFMCEPKESVVRETLDALAFGHGRLIPGILVRLPMLLAESTPRFLLRLFFGLMSGQFRREREAAPKP